MESCKRGTKFVGCGWIMLTIFCNEKRGTWNAWVNLLFLCSWLLRNTVVLGQHICLSQPAFNSAGWLHLCPHHNHMMTTTSCISHIFYPPVYFPLSPSFPHLDKHRHPPTISHPAVILSFQGFFLCNNRFPVFFCFLVLLGSCVTSEASWGHLAKLHCTSAISLQNQWVMGVSAAHQDNSIFKRKGHADAVQSKTIFSIFRFPKAFRRPFFVAECGMSLGFLSWLTGQCFDVSLNINDGVYHWWPFSTAERVSLKPTDFKNLKKAAFISYAQT